MAAVESNKGPLGRRLGCDRGESERDLPTTRLLSTLDVIAGSHSPASDPSDIPWRRLHQQGKYRGLHLLPRVLNAMPFSNFLSFTAGFSFFPLLLSGGLAGAHPLQARAAVCMFSICSSSN